jgi:hypothetical protein
VVLVEAVEVSFYSYLILVVLIVLVLVVFVVVESLYFLFFGFRFFDALDAFDALYAGILSLSIFFTLHLRVFGDRGIFVIVFSVLLLAPYDVYHIIVKKLLFNIKYFYF